MTAVASAASAFRRAQPPIAAAEVSAANGALLSGTLQRAVKAVFAQYIAQLARALQLRQGVVATAVAFFRRFYTRHSFKAHDPRHVAPACLFLAAKVEESTVSAKAVAQAVVEYWAADSSVEPAFAGPYWLDEAALSKKELVLIEALDFKLLERHPYEALETLLQDASLGHHSTRCYAIANDTYRYTDLCMLQPPEVVAVACLMLAADAPLSEAQAWAQRSPGTDPEAVCLAIEELLQAYERPALTTRACHIALASDT